MDKAKRFGILKKRHGYDKLGKVNGCDHMSNGNKTLERHSITLVV